MNSLQIIDDFELQRKTARKVDITVSHLEEKLTNIGSLGLSVNPENTRLIAENCLKRYEDEIEDVKNNVDSCLKNQTQVLDDAIDNDDKILQFLKDARNELREIELLLQSNGNYQAYEPAEKDDDEIANHAKCEQSSYLEPSNDNTQETIESPSSRKLLSFSSCNNSLEHIVSPLLLSNGRDVSRIRNGCRSEVDGNKSMNESYLNSSKSFRQKKVVDTVLRTPVDPGVSAVTRNLLGRSNIKPQIRKEICPST